LPSTQLVVDSKALDWTIFWKIKLLLMVED